MSSWSIKNRIALGFGVVLTLLAAVGLWSLHGVGRIVDDAGAVIDGNQLRATMVQLEVDHLQWATRSAS